MRLDCSVCKSSLTQYSLDVMKTSQVSEITIEMTQVSGFDVVVHLLHCRLWWATKKERYSDPKMQRF